MDKLKLLQLNFVELTGSHENFSEDLRWLCWFGFHLRTVPSGLYMGNMVAIDMSYSNLEVFDPPMVLHSLKILNLKDSHNLFEIRDISWIPHLETLILWNCHNLVRVSKIGDLTSLAQLNLTGCKSLCEEQESMLVELKASSSGGVTEEPPFSFPHSLQQLFLNNCDLECTDSFPLSFSVQLFLRYLNLSNGLFVFLPSYDHLINLRVLDLSFCSSLKCLLCLPNTLAELYIYYCTSLEKITFQSPRFMLQEFGYEGCINLAEIEGFMKLIPIAKLDETDLGHLKWLKKYQSHEVLLVGDDELTIGRSSDLQMLYEFNIMSTSLPDIEDSKAMPEYISESPSLFFDVPSCPKNRRLKGLNVTFKYTLWGDDWAWFAKIRTNNGVDLMYNPKVFGKPGYGEVGIWLSYWPIGSTLHIGDTVNVSIVVLGGLEVHECGVTLVYTDDEVAEETLENNMGWEEVLGGDLTGFQLSTGAYYLCRRDFFEQMEVERLTPDWFRILVGDTIDYTEVRGWRKTGRPKQSNPSFTELKTVRCIIDGPGAEEIYILAEMSKSSLLDKTAEFTSSILGETMKSGTTSESSDAATKDKSDGYSVDTMGMSKASVSNKTMESASTPHKEKLKSVVTDDVGNQDKDSEPSSLQGFQPCCRFEFPEIQLATKDFDESLIIGRGGFGKVYKGNVIIGSRVVVAAIKRLESMSNQGATEFWVEVEMLSKLRHGNLVSLFGYCNYEKEMILVYEYMPNGTLEDHLHKLGTPLSWLQRLNICIDAARGLYYLHRGTGIEGGVIHGDFRSSNIFLDESWRSKLSDFGLSRISPTNQAPTYMGYTTGKLTKKSDVYAFGAVLLEVLSRKHRNLPRWVQESSQLVHNIDPDISGQISSKCLKEFVRLVERCLHIDPEQRPTMAGVLLSLESMLTLQEDFNKAGIFDRMVDMLPLNAGVRALMNLRPKMSSTRGPWRADTVKNLDQTPSKTSTSTTPSMSLDDKKVEDDELNQQVEDDEFNQKVEAFIKKFNDELRAEKLTRSQP